MYKSLFGILMILSSLLPAALPADDAIGHRLRVSIDPEAGEIAVSDRLTLPERMRGKRLDFRLHPALTITGSSGGQLTTDAPGHHTFTPDGSGLAPTLEYRGRIRHPLRDISDAPGRTQQATLGHVGPDGVFLAAASGWYPLVGELPVTFELAVELPRGWLAVSQGEAVDDAPNHWRETQPQEEIYLVAGKYSHYVEDDGVVRAEVYLRQPDPELARRYLDATERYIGHYGELLGKYPYAKFALVENFWESGYGMPSFTLLGPTVIRLPFIIHTSYPHEIVHNWFGNGVYVDWRGGNWSEGLTTYLADHHLREQQGKAADYRRDQLKSWADHAARTRDFPLAEFTGRHGDASQAVGYGKAMMFFHMIRKKIGDEAFMAGLRRFISDNLFRRAGYDDLRRAWETTGKRSLKTFFEQWLHRTGAPKLALAKPQVRRDGDHYGFTAILRQIQNQAPYPLTVPLRFSFDDGRPAITKTVATEERDKHISFTFAQRPTQVAADPDYDCFRQLYPEENPLTLSTVFGSETATIVLPAAAPERLKKKYRLLAEQWAAKRKGSWKIVHDTDLTTLPRDRAVIVLGWENRLADTARGQTFIEGLDIDRGKQSLTLTNAEAGTVLFIASERPAAIAGLARKLPHYGKYSYLVFTGDAPSIAVKGQWRARRSPLVVLLE